MQRNFNDFAQRQAERAAAEKEREADERAEKEAAQIKWLYHALSEEARALVEIPPIAEVVFVRLPQEHERHLRLYGGVSPEVGDTIFYVETVGNITTEQFAIGFHSRTWGLFTDNANQRTSDIYKPRHAKNVADLWEQHCERVRSAAENYGREWALKAIGATTAERHEMIPVLVSHGGVSSGIKIKALVEVLRFIGISADVAVGQNPLAFNLSAYNEASELPDHEGNVILLAEITGYVKHFDFEHDGDQAAGQWELCDAGNQETHVSVLGWKPLPPALPSTDADDGFGGEIPY